MSSNRNKTIITVRSRPRNYIYILICNHNHLLCGRWPRGTLLRNLSGSIGNGDPKEIYWWMGPSSSNLGRPSTRRPGPRRTCSPPFLLQPWSGSRNSQAPCTAWRVKHANHMEEFVSWLVLVFHMLILFEFDYTFLYLCFLLKSFVTSLFLLKQLWNMYYLSSKSLVCLIFFC